MAGYKGFSMSNNAVQAYADGEKPLSKWNKSDILDGLLEQVSRKSANEIEPLLKKKSAQELKSKFLQKTSWHHTSSKFNKTDFYSIKQVEDSELRNYVGLNSTKENLLKGLIGQKMQKEKRLNAESVFNKIKRKTNFNGEDISKLGDVFSSIEFYDGSRIRFDRFGLNGYHIGYDTRKEQLEQAFVFPSNEIGSKISRWSPPSLNYIMTNLTKEDVEKANKELHKILNKKVLKFNKR